MPAWPCCAPIRRRGGGAQTSSGHPGRQRTICWRNASVAANASVPVPTAAIQPSLAEAGLEGLWTPVLVPRLGYCDYACNACGWACPVQAIPPLTLEEKRQQVIGKASIDQNRCIPWADFRDCIVCEEMCPIPEKAIVLEQYEGPDALGETVSVKRPRVLRDRCIGCGICEYKCPAVGEAAIRVHAPSSGGVV